MSKFKINLILIIISLLGLIPLSWAGEEVASPPSISQEEVINDFLWKKFISLPAETRPKIALVLGGGGARGLSHIGVLKILTQEHLPIDIIVGTSVGSLIGGLSAAGLPLEKIEKMAEDIGWDKISNISFASLVRLLVAEKLLSSEKMEKYLQEHIGNKRFDELPTKFACIACDIQTGERIIFRDGPVVPAMRASATIPGVFQPVEYRHRLLVDGGVVDNVPVDVAWLMGADVVIAVPVLADFTSYQTSNVLLILNQAIYIQGKVMAEPQLEKATLVITPKVGEIHAMELWRGKECITAGLIAARGSIAGIKNFLIKKYFGQILLNQTSAAHSP